MKKFIITTTILPPTEAIEKYDAMPDWSLIVTGDRKSPPEYPLKRGRFVTWEQQQKDYPDLCKLIGPDSTARGRMIGIIEAYKAGADIICTIDDDNFPLKGWGQDIALGESTRVEIWDELCWEPLWSDDNFWHRGFPLQLLKNHTDESQPRLNVKTFKPLFQANLWNGDPDVDAFVRIGRKLSFRSFLDEPSCGSHFSPMNSQNTMFLAEYAKDYCPFPFIGRAEDIWASYIFQAIHPNSSVYMPATVEHRQERTMESLIKDLEDEMFGYKHTFNMLQALSCAGVHAAMDNYFPEGARLAWGIYRSYF